MARYNVMDRETAARFGIKSEGEYNQHALVTMTNESQVDGIVCWGFKKENLQAIADKRNADIEGVKEKLSTTMTYLD
jgi:hypothetical protein